MNKNILLYTDDPGVGGVAQYNHNLVKGLAALNYRVTCVQSKSDNPLVSSQKEFGIQHIWLEFDTVKDFGRTLTYQVDAQNILTTYKPDFIVFSDSCPLSNFAAKQVAIELGIPYITVIGFVAPYLAERFAAYLDKLSYQYAQAREVVAVSSENLTLLYELFRLPKDKGKVIYYGRSEQYFTPPSLLIRDRLRQEFEIPSNAVVCFTAARLELVKGYQYQLEAIKQLKQSAVWDKLYFVWAGAGNLETQLKNAIEQLGVSNQVKLLGQRWDVQDWLDASDIFILPSELEGMPLCIMEAMAKGLPVIASRVSGIPEELGNTGKLLADPTVNPQATVTELVTTIQTWFVNAELRQSIGQDCKKRAEEMFGEGRMVKETVEVIERALLPVGDYVSPGFSIVLLDKCFPNMIVGDANTCPWSYLRREIPHNWYVDKRQPTVGFLSRDEAHILYNTALKFQGKKALEIGCWLGWSACHLALAGVELDVVDPLLERPDFYESVSNSLKATGVLDAVNLIAGYSPQKVEELADQSQHKWSLIFIDGNHDAPSPLNDAIACERLAENDALILFHDLASPDVTQGLDYLKQRGWNTMVYQTMQIMGVAWRGNVEPIKHIPDQSINWQLPLHLQHYVVSGIQTNQVNPLISQSVTRHIFNNENNIHLASQVSIRKTAVLECMYGGSISVGSGTEILDHAMLLTYGGAIDIGENCSINPFTIIYGHGGTKIGNDVLIAAHTVIIPSNHNFLSLDIPIRLQGNTSKGITIEDDVWIGAGCKILDGVTIGRGSVVAAGAVVNKNIEPFSVVGGVPAKLIKKRTSKGDLSKPLPVNDSEFQKLLCAVRPYTLLSEERLFSLYCLAKKICLDDIFGNFVECGTCKGGSAAVLAYVIKHYSKQPRLVYAFDTFEGMPEPTECDRHQGIPANSTGFGSGTLKAPISENLVVICEILNIKKIVVPIKGLFSETLPKYKSKIGDIALLHADGDWYESTIDIFNNLYDSVVSQGYVQVDDYGHWEGCKKALHDFESLRGKQFNLHQIDYTGVWFQKNVKYIDEVVKKYLQSESDLSVTNELRHLRKQITEYWLSVGTNQLEKSYAIKVNEGLKSLTSSGIQKEELTESEQQLMNEILAHISKGFDEPKAIQYLLAAMLYRRADQLPLQHDLTHIPQWLLDDYLKFVLEFPCLFQEKGEADNYYRYLEQWLDYLLENLSRNQESASWQYIAQFFLQAANFIPLYFTTENLKGIYTKRADIIEYTLRTQGYEIDYNFTDRSPERKKIRLGVLAAHFQPSTETFHTLPAYKHLDWNIFEVILYTVNANNSRLERYCAGHADALVALPSDLQNQVQTIRDDNLDLLLIATNVTAVTNSITLLALHRLARIQLTFGSSPTTTGIRNIDYFISGSLSEPISGGQEHYREKLVTLDGVGYCFDYLSELETPTIKPNRDNWGATEKTIVFTSGANCYKIIPELRETWAKILAAVPDSILVLYPFSPSWSNSYPATPFLNQMHTVLAKYDVDKTRLIVLDALPSRADVKEVLRLADAYLDSYRHSGGHSLVDALEVGLPTVVLEGNTLRSRHASAYLREIQIPDLITNNEMDYIKLAIALGTNSELRQQKSDQIKKAMQANPSFLDSRAYSAQMGQIFQELFCKYQADKLTENFKLRENNLIVFPDWSQPEDLLYQDLASAIATLGNHPDRKQTTLLIDRGNLTEDEATLFVSGVVMNLVMEEDLDVADELEISLVGQLSEIQWKALLPRIQARIVLENEDKEAIAQVKAENLPFCELDRYC